jgi:hypothetical protein
MKKSHLLEIIREEISSALREGEAEERAAKAAELKAIDAKQKALDAERKDTMKGGALEEDQLNEMAYDIIVSQPNELAKLQDKIKDSTKKGEQKLAKALEIIQKTKKEGKPIRQRDIANEMGVIQQEINPLINKLIDVGILEKGESVTGVTKKKVTNKAQGRPTSAEPKTKTEKAPKAEPKKAEEEDDEVAAATKAISGDETAKDLGKTSSIADKFANLFNVKTTEEAKEKMKELAKKANSGDQKAKAFFDDEKNKKIIQSYRKAQKVNA